MKRFVPFVALMGALALPGAAGAEAPVSTTADQAACDAYVYVGEGSFRHGDYQVTTPEQTVRLSDHTGALGEQDPCAD